MRFTSEPCGVVVQALSPHAIPDNANMFIQSESEAIGRAMARQGMAWGFVLGFDHANGGLWDGDQSTLSRFTAACSVHPEWTGAEVLQSLTR